MKIKEPSAAYKRDRKPFTYQDYQRLPEDDYRYQVINGELIMTPSPVTVHQRVLRKILTLLDRFVETEKLGEVFCAPFDVVLDDYNVFQPDILFVSHKNAGIITEKNIQGAPDLVFEILSPSSGYYDLIEKKENYTRFGVMEYWIVDPKNEWLEVFVNEGGEFKSQGRISGEQSLRSSAVQDFELNTGELFLN